MIKYTPALLKKLEEMFDENGYTVRYEKGNFKSGYCLIEDKKMVMVNKFAPMENRINTLLEISRILVGNQTLQGERAIQIEKMLLKQSNLEEATG